MNVVMINDGAANESLENEISQFIILDVLNIRFIIIHYQNISKYRGIKEKNKLHCVQKCKVGIAG